MSRYWFFAATLPGLSFGTPVPMTEAEFLERCAISLSREDLAEVRAIPSMLAEGRVPGNLRSGFLRAFMEWERGFRNELALLRAKRYGEDASPWLKEGRSEPGQAQSASSCFGINDPLEAELALERERWAAIDRLSALHAFDLDAIAAYRLRLAIAARVQSFERQRGTAAYSRMYDDIIRPAAARDAETTESGVQA